MDAPHNVDISSGTCMRQKQWVLQDPDGIKDQILKLLHLVLVGIIVASNVNQTRRRSEAGNEEYGSVFVCMFLDGDKSTSSCCLKISGLSDQDLTSVY